MATRTRSLAITNISAGSSSGVTRPIQKAITNLDEWTKFWTEHASRQFPTPKLPEVNFDQEMVIAIYLGERSSGTTTLNVVKVEEKAKTVAVTYTAKGSSGFGCSALNQPHVLVKVSKSTKTLVFVKEEPKTDSE